MHIARFTSMKNGVFILAPVDAVVHVARHEEERGGVMIGSCSRPGHGMQLRR